MVAITPNIQTEFFTYFSIDGNAARYREQEQIWNYNGIAIKVQGTAYDGSYNGFGKRHLVYVKDGDGQSPRAKARKLAVKRAGNPAQSRQKKIAKTPGLGAPHYTAAVYGPNTPTTTCIVLNGFGRDEIAKCFHDAIVEATGDLWVNGKVRRIEVVFPDDIVYVIDSTDRSHPYVCNAVIVDVTKDGMIYHVTHLDGCFRNL